VLAEAEVTLLVLVLEMEHLVVQQVVLVVLVCQTV
jgi:hypothetical protein